MTRLVLDILIDDERWQRITRLRPRLKNAAEVAFMNLPKTLRIFCDLTVLLTDDASIRRLNRDFRGIDKPTNVLSFPQYTATQLTKKVKTGWVMHAGDIALGYQYVVGEAKRDNKILINHTIHLLIHGLLHNFGYDHRSGAGAARMERLEKKIMATLGLPDPYVSQPKEPKAR